MSMAPLKKESGTLKSSMLFSISTRKRLDSSSKIISRIKQIVLGRQFMKNIGKIKKKQKKNGGGKDSVVPPQTLANLLLASRLWSFEGWIKLSTGWSLPGGSCSKFCSHEPERLIQQCYCRRNKMLVAPRGETKQHLRGTTKSLTCLGLSLQF